MAWKTLKTISYTGAGLSTGAGITVTLEYDNSVNSVTTLKLRFRGTSTKDTYYKSNGFYVLWAPNTSSEKIYDIKPVGDTWSGASTDSFTVSKTYSATSFTIPEFWICHTGSVTPNKTTRKIYYDDEGTKTVYWYFTNNRKNYKTVVSGWSENGSATTKVATAVGAGTVSITDNGNNAFILKGAKGANGTNNTATGPTLYWGYTSDYGNTFTNNVLVEFTPSNYNDTITVYAKCVTGATYGDDSIVKTQANIIQWFEPYTPNKPVLTSSSFKSGRLTIDQKWTYTWTSKGSPNNNTSPVKGYRIRLYKNGSIIPIKNSSGSTLSVQNPQSSTDYYYDYDTTASTVSFEIDPVQNGFSPGDTIKLGIYAYNIWGDGRKHFNNSGGSGGHVFSNQTSVENSAIVHVRVDGRWVDGIVYVRKDGIWVQAESVSVRSGGQWVESK